MSTEPEPNFVTRMGRALTWSLKTIIRFVIVILLLLGLASLIQFGLQQYNRRLANINGRIDLLHSDIGNLMESDTVQRRTITDLQADTQDQSRQLSAVQNDLAHQDELLASLELQVTELVVSSDTITRSVASLGTGLVALQSDVNENGSRIDALGGQIDGLNSNVTALDAQASSLEEMLTTPDDEIARLQKALALFRLWELVARARLRLAEDNPGMAAVDVEQAIASADALVATANAAANEEEAEALQLPQVRLALALTNLPDNPAEAARDLESAWEELDRLLAALVVPEAAATVISITPSITPTLEITPTAVLTPTATP